MRKSPECPTCAHWECTRCGHTRASVNRFAKSTKCPQCGNDAGVFTTSVRHRDRSLHRLHVMMAQHAGITHAPFPTYDRMINAMVLVRQLDDPYTRFNAAVLDAQMYGSEESGFTEARARGNAALLEIESIVRTWVIERPSTSGRSA